MAKKLTWYEKGFEEGLACLPSDPPAYPKHSAYRNYMQGYADGERQFERNCDAEDRATAKAEGFFGC